jgi:hypothetical protein
VSGPMGLGLAACVIELAFCGERHGPSDAGGGQAGKDGVDACRIWEGSAPVCHTRPVLQSD